MVIGTLGSGCQLIFRLEETPCEEGADSDGDLIDDGCDPCPMLADDGHDEDGDGFGDACDNCPAIANEDQADRSEDAIPGGATADGIGDACDPDPGLITVRQQFHSFAGDDQLTWEKLSGAWEFDDDAVRYLGPELGLFRNLERLPSGDNVLTVVFGISAETELVAGAEMQVVLDDNNGADSPTCGLVRFPPPDDTFDSVAIAYVGPPTGDGDALPEIIVPGTRYRVTARYHRPTTLKCTAGLVDEPNPSIAELVLNPAPAAGDIAFRGNQTGFRVDYVEAYVLPATP